MGTQPASRMENIVPVASTALRRPTPIIHPPAHPPHHPHQPIAHLQHAGAGRQHVLPGEGASVQPQRVAPRLQGDGRGVGGEIHCGAGAPWPSRRQAVHRHAELAVGRRLGRLLTCRRLCRRLSRSRWRGGTHPPLLSAPLPELSGWVCGAASTLPHPAPGRQGGAGGRGRGVAPAAIWHVADVGMAGWVGVPIAPDRSQERDKTAAWVQDFIFSKGPPHY